MRYVGYLFLGITFTEADKICNSDIVKTAESQGFVKSMVNCLHNADTTPGPEACLSQFVAANASNNLFPITDGECRDAYQKLLDDWVTAGVSTGGQCTGPDFTEDEVVPIDCYYRELNSGLRNFYTTTGYFPSTLCSAAELRVRTADYFAAIVSASARNVVYTDPLVEPCDSCYSHDIFQYHLRQFSVVSGTNSAVLEGCTAPDGPTDVCMESSSMINSRRMFEACAGYDILFKGPMCSNDQVDMVEAMVPTPFYTIAHCAYNPRTPFCSTMGGYMQAISDITDTYCGACYAEFNAELAALALADIDEKCTEDVLADNCLIYITDALNNFEICAGKTIGTDGPN